MRYAILLELYFNKPKFVMFEGNVIGLETKLSNDSINRLIFINFKLKL